MAWVAQRRDGCGGRSAAGRRRCSVWGKRCKGRPVRWGTETGLVPAAGGAEPGRAALAGGLLCGRAADLSRNKARRYYRRRRLSRASPGVVCRLSGAGPGTCAACRYFV